MGPINLDRIREELIAIENNLGIYANHGIPRAHQRDAGRLIDAMRSGDRETARRIWARHQREETKGDVQGGPKEVKCGDVVRGVIARAARLFLFTTRYTPAAPGIEEGTR